MHYLPNKPHFVLSWQAVDADGEDTECFEIKLQEKTSYICADNFNNKDEPRGFSVCQIGFS